MYGVSDYGSMIADDRRMHAYHAALGSTISPASIVIDVGAGTGIFSLLACQLGARRVYAIESNPAIELARQTAKANGFDDRMTCINDDSTHVTLPERGNVLVSDLRGILPLFGQHIPAVVHAREHLLTRGATQIPRADAIWAALIEAPDLYRDFAGCWDARPWGLDLRASRHASMNSWQRGKVAPDQLLTDACCWMTIDYTSVTSPNATGVCRWTARRDGHAHGLALWFDTVLADDAGFSNAPGSPDQIYGQAFFPLEDATDVRAGDEVEVSLNAQLVNGDYVWSWNTRISRQGRAIAAFKQSTFYGTPLAATSLRKRAADYAPLRNEDGDIDLLALSLIGTDSLEAIAGRVAHAFPGRFRDWRQALGRVGDLSVKYAK